MFHRIYDYQAILEIKKWNAMGNFDRVSEMLLIGIYWKSIDIKGRIELASRKKVEDTEDQQSIMEREWF